MQIMQFETGGAPAVIDSTDISLDAGDFVWADIERSEFDGHENALSWLGIRLHDQHVRDTLNDTHPPYYDGTDDYDLLIVRALCPGSPPEEPSTRPIAIVVTTGAVVSIRPPEDPVFVKFHQRLLNTQRKATTPTSSTMLLYLLLEQIVDGLLARRDITSEVLSRWQERLLDGTDQFDDWRALMNLRGRLRRLEVVTEGQLDAVDDWRELSSLELDNALEVRFNDLQEHLRRVYNHTIVMQHDIDAVVQIYFSSNAQRTNETLQFLAVISAIFLPLNLLAGLFGMNFTNLPLLRLWYGPWVVVGVGLLMVTGLLYWFRRKRWV